MYVKQKNKYFNYLLFKYIFIKQYTIMMMHLALFFLIFM